MRIYKVILETPLSNKIKYYELINLSDLSEDYLQKIECGVYFVENCQIYVDMDNRNCEHIISKGILKILKRDVYISTLS